MISMRIFTFDYVFRLCFDVKNDSRKRIEIKRTIIVFVFNFILG